MQLAYSTIALTVIRMTVQRTRSRLCSTAFRSAWNRSREPPIAAELVEVAATRGELLERLSDAAASAGQRGDQDDWLVCGLTR